MSSFKLTHFAWDYPAESTARCSCNLFLSKHLPLGFNHETEILERYTHHYRDPHSEEILHTYRSQSEADHFARCLQLAEDWSWFRRSIKSYPRLCCLVLKKFSSDPTPLGVRQPQITVEKMAVGSLLHCDGFVVHYSSPPGLCADFNHDSREVVIQCFPDNPESRLEVLYSSVLKIFLSFPRSKDYLKIYLQLRHPPLLLKGCSQTTEIEFYEGWPVLTKDVVAKSTFVMLVLKKKTALSVLERFHARCPTVDFVVTFVHEKRFEPGWYALQNPDCDRQLCFHCLYAWKVLNNYAFWVNDSLARHRRGHSAVTKKLLDLETFSHAVFQKTCFNLFLAMEGGQFFNIVSAFTNLFRKGVEEKREENEPLPGLCVIRKVIYTPTRRIYLPPQQHVLNRFLRNYEPEYALQVSIKQENMKKLTHQVQNNADYHAFMEETFQLVSGLTIGERHYDFLGCSNSQMRDHGFWMYARDTRGRTARTIMDEIGFEKIQGNGAKKLTRMGLFFSSSEKSHELPESCVVVQDYPDIYSPSGKIFSDGVGKVSSSIAQLLRNGGSGYQPSAFQIRYPGFKGMLVEDPTLKGDVVCFRKSMHKFTSNTHERVVEVLKKSAPRRLFLNRSLIMILEQHDVPQWNLTRMQERMVEGYVDALVYEPAAAELLHQFVTLHFPVRELVRAGVALTADTFFRRLLTSIYRKRLGLLRSKAHIAVDPLLGRNMFGVLDETGQLQSGQVFVQYSESLSGDSPVRVLTGPVLVTRNPCHHPGDVRRLSAVYCRSLSHLKDCVVFPAVGDRPHQDMMGGGDLDGDEFVVLWDQGLVFEKNSEPMVYPSVPAAQETASNVEVKDLVTFFYDFILFDNIGLFSNAHLVAGDMEPKGIFSQKCKGIAKKIPLALDFIKTGSIEKLDLYEKPREYPDYMDKGCQKPSYRSSSTLGELYRKVCMYLPPGVMCLDLAPVPNKLLEYPGWEEFREVALQERCRYEDSLHALLANYGVESLEECLTGHVTSAFHFTGKEQENLLTVLEKNISRLVVNTRLKFEELCFVRHEVPDAKLKMASAWYMVTYGDDKAVEFSFPWCIASHLCEVAKQDQGARPESAAMDYLAALIVEEYERSDWSPVDIIYRWATAHQALPPGEEARALLTSIYDTFFYSTLSRPKLGLANCLIHLIKFFKWLSSEVTELSHGSLEIQDKLKILASMTMSCFPLTLDMGYLGLKRAQDEEETWMPLVPRDVEFLRLHKSKAAKFRKRIFHLKKKSGVFFLDFIEAPPTRGPASSTQICQHVICRTKGLPWQIIYLENLILTLAETNAFL